MAKTNKTTTDTEKTRKVTSGHVREKARTINKLIMAVGKVIQKQSYAGLNIANICKEAGVDRRLVYTYFGSLDNLVETYIKQKDYWKSDAREHISSLLEKNEYSIIELLKGNKDLIFIWSFCQNRYNRKTIGSIEI